METFVEITRCRHGFLVILYERGPRGDDEVIRTLRFPTSLEMVESHEFLQMVQECSE